MKTKKINKLISVYRNEIKSIIININTTKVLGSDIMKAAKSIKYYRRKIELLIELKKIK